MSTLIADEKEQNLGWRATKDGRKIAYLRMKLSDRDRWQSLGELAPDDARLTVRRLRRDNNLEQLERRLDMVSRRSDVSTIEDLFTTYTDWSKGVDIAAPTVKKNKQCLSLILETVLGSAYSEETTRVSAFTVDACRQYSAKVIEARKAESEAQKWDAEKLKAKLASAQRTIRSTVRQARSLFCKEAMSSVAYRDLVLPDMSAVMRLVIGESTLVAYQRPPQEVLDTIARDAAALKLEDPAKWLALQLEVNIGLRRSSARQAKWEWLQERGVDRDGVPWVECYVAVAKGGESWVRIDHAFYQELLAFRKEGQVYILPGKDEAERDEVLAGLVDWLRDRGLDRRMPNHELRKWYGDSKYTEHGASEAQNALGQSDSKLTSKVYASKRSIKALRVV